jgi:uncharacterized protein YcbK (DUF882 family)
MSVSRRTFLKLLAGTALIGACESLPAQQSQSRPRILWIQRGEDQGLLDIDSPEGYRGACWLMRDTIADRSAMASMGLLRTVAWMQAFLAAYHIHKPFIIHSGFRTRFTNERCGGAKASLHMSDGAGFFHAADIEMDGISPDYLGRLAALAHQGGVGFYTDRKHGFVHVDDGRVRYWRG